MFQVVAAVDKYPEFLPLCESIDVASREKRGAATELVATMSIGYHALSESFTSRVKLHPDEREIFVTYLDGTALRDPLCGYRPPRHTATAW